MGKLTDEDLFPPKHYRIHPNIPCEAEMSSVDEYDQAEGFEIGYLRERLSQWSPITELVYLSKIEALAVINFLDSLDEKKEMPNLSKD